MKCPSCSSIDLLMSERQGIEIDYCPKCRGVWLDRGELDKFIARAEQQVAAAVQERPAVIERIPESYAPPPSKEEYERRKWKESEYRDDDHYRGGYRGKKKESFWGELFDFD